MNEASISFEGLLTDYALGEMNDPDTRALLEALLERDESLRASLAEIRNTTELIVLAGPESLVGDTLSRRPPRVHRPARIAVAVGIAAALVLVTGIWWWPPSSNTQNDLNVAGRPNDAPPSAAAETPESTADAATSVSEQPLPWLTAAAENRTPRPNRRGAGIRWSSLVVGQAADRQ